MNWFWRLVLYAALAAVAYFSASEFLAGFSRQMERAAQRFDSAETAQLEPRTPAETPPPPDTNAPGDDLTPTQAVAAATTPPGTNVPAPAAPPPAAPAAGAPTVRGGFSVVWGVVALAAILALGLLVGREVAGYLTQRVHREIYGEASEPVGDPEYEEAEAIWARGDHLEAIRLLREFLNKKPGKLHAAFRIAEIYEKDLKNPLAAALEYESILAHRFDPERWGWAAIHLVNLYNRLGQAEKAEATLRRIVATYPQSAAAAKARERLGEPLETAPEEPPPPADGQFHLPRGFRPKKG